MSFQPLVRSLLASAVLEANELVGAKSLEDPKSLDPESFLEPLPLMAALNSFCSALSADFAPELNPSSFDRTLFWASATLEDLRTGGCKPPVPMPLIADSTSLRMESLLLSYMLRVPEPSTLAIWSLAFSVPAAICC